MSVFYGYVPRRIPCGYKTYNQNIDSLRVILESVTTLANIASPEDFSDYEKGFEITIIAHIESVIGIFMNIICLARFISLLPPIQSIDKNWTRAILIKYAITMVKARGVAAVSKNWWCNKL